MLAPPSAAQILTGDASLFNPLDRAAFLELARIALATAAIIVATRYALSWLSNRLHGRLRHGVLSAVLPIRLAVIVVALALALSIVIEPSLSNMLTLLRAVGLATGSRSTATMAKWYTSVCVPWR